MATKEELRQMFTGLGGKQARQRRQLREAGAHRIGRPKSAPQKLMARISGGGVAEAAPKPKVRRGFPPMKLMRALGKF